jgi:hypothetical protein
MRQGARILALFLLVIIGAAGQYAQATTYNVNCDKHEHIAKALRVLASANPQGPNTINISGVCRGNFVIQSMDRLTLITKNGASLTDRSGGTLPVVDIEDSQKVTLQGFTINGGNRGVVCSTASICYLTGNTIQGPGNFGVNVFKGARAFFESNVIQNWNRGSFISDGAQVFSSNDVFQGNSGSAIVVLGAIFESVNSTFDHNGVGIDAGGGGLGITGGSVSGNIGIGVRLLGNVSTVFGGPTITGNGGVGVHLEDGAFAGFLAANITGNTGLDIECAPKFPITRFVARTGGITNCVESASNAQAKPVE